MKSMNPERKTSCLASSGPKGFLTQKLDDRETREKAYGLKESRDFQIRNFLISLGARKVRTSMKVRIIKITLEKEMERRAVHHSWGLDLRGRKINNFLQEMINTF